MKKVISFGIWGSNPTYTLGAIRVAEQAKEMYPDFECWFYIHTESVPKDIVSKLEKMSNTKIIYKSGDLSKGTCTPMMWRFEAIDDPEVSIMLSRDTDTKFLKREILAVQEWLASDCVFHIMRDHPHHTFPILGGMFGTRKIPQIPNWSEKMSSVIKKSDRMYDQDFLKDCVYPVVKENSMIHATFHKYESQAKNFPIDYDDELRFVGEYVYHDESRSNSHVAVLKHIIGKK